MEEDKETLLSPDEQCDQPMTEIKIYKSRWLMLFLFSLTTCLNGSIFMGLSPVVKIVAPAYGIDDVHIESLSNMYLIVFVLISLPSAYVMAKFGVRSVLTFAALCDVIATIFQYSGAYKGRFPLVAVGQCFAAFAYGNMLHIPGRLSALWFPIKERGIATSIGASMNILGMAVGFVQPSCMIPATADQSKVFSALRLFFLTKLIFAVITFVFTALLYREEPPTPSSYIDEDEPEVGFLKSLSALVKDKNFMLMSQGYGIYFGLFASVAIIVAPLVTWQHGVDDIVQHFIGWMGLSAYLMVIIFCFLLGMYLDRTSQYKQVAILSNGASAVFWFVFCVVLMKTNSLPALLVVYVIYGIFGISYFATGVEHAAEMTSPIPEGTSSSVILLLGNLYGFLLILLLGALIEYKYPVTALSIVLGLYILSTMLLCLSKTHLKRTESQSLRSSKAHLASLRSSMAFSQDITVSEKDSLLKGDPEEEDDADGIVMHMNIDK